MPRPRSEKVYFTYIMASSSGTLYVGMTNSLMRRVEQHRLGSGSVFTSRYKVDRLVYYESYRYVLNAIAREREIKGWKREKKVALIESVNPGWRDLSREFGMRVRAGERDSSSG